MELDFPLVAILVASALSLVILGGGFYEILVVDPFWPQRPELIQPQRGGISRRRFWIPAHTAFEVTLIVALVAAWPSADVRGWLLIALASHALMRLWSAFDFIPKALAFEKAEQVDAGDARRWTHRSRLRLPLDVVTCYAMLAAAVRAAAGA